VGWKGVEDPCLDEVFELTDADFYAGEVSAERVPVLTLDEAHQVLTILVQLANGTGDQAETARRLARELAARIPSAT
ncbi:DUF6417 family protein, partial [Streptomyces sp. NPDC093568]|uniref:DUF6417 family protein n=1 Tax=Streptomyces sp. NPDC093568 TaxID=3366041 RepID=UPI00380E96E9